MGIAESQLHCHAFDVFMSATSFAECIVVGVLPNTALSKY